MKCFSRASGYEFRSLRRSALEFVRQTNTGQGKQNNPDTNSIIGILVQLDLIVFLSRLLKLFAFISYFTLRSSKRSRKNRDIGLSYGWSVKKLMVFGRKVSACKV